MDLGQTNNRIKRFTYRWDVALEAGMVAKQIDGGHAMPTEAGGAGPIKRR